MSCALYASIFERWDRRALRPWANQLSPLSSGPQWPTLAAGPGSTGTFFVVRGIFTASWQQERVTSCERLVGVHFSPVAIGRLERFMVYNDLPLAEASVLPLEDKSVDTALSMENLEHLFPNEVGPALAELARIARRRVVITTPSPSRVINGLWLAGEILEAEADPVLLPYAEFLVLAGCVHKSSLSPWQMRLVGFDVFGPPEKPTSYAPSVGVADRGTMMDLAQVNASAYGARHSIPRNRARPKNTSSSHQSRARCDGKHLWSSSTFRRARSGDSGTYTDGRPRSPSHLGISYARYKASRKTVGRISAIVRWSWWASSRPGAIMRSGEQFRATSSRVSLTRPQTAGSRPSGRSRSSTVNTAPGKNACAACRASI